MTRPVLYLHSSAGLYGADLLLPEIVRGSPRPAVCVLPFDGPLAERLREAGAEVKLHPLAVLRRSLATPRGVASVAAAMRADRGVLRGLAKRHGAALVHANTSVVLSAGAAGLPHVVHVREIYAGTGFGPLWPALRWRLERADALVAISDAVAAQFERIEVVHDGLARPVAPAPRAAARAALGLPADAFVVALIGRVSDWKGQDVLARALAEVPNAVGLVVGDGVPGSGAEADLDALARDLGVADRLHRTGFRADLADPLGAADVLVVPSTRPEPLGQVALEGSAAGLPVIASRGGGLPEAVRDERTGLLTPPGDAAALAAALRRLRDDPTLRARLGAAGREHVAAGFSLSEMQERLNALHDRLA